MFWGNLLTQFIKQTFGEVNFELNVGSKLFERGQSDWLIWL